MKNSTEEACMGCDCITLTREEIPAADLAAENARLKRERDAWIDTANQMTENASFYRGLVARIGEHFGVEAKTSDDGSIQQDVLALKVPELVARDKAKLAKYENPSDEAIEVEGSCGCVFCDVGLAPDANGLHAINRNLLVSCTKQEPSK